MSEKSQGTKEGKVVNSLWWVTHKVLLPVYLYCQTKATLLRIFLETKLYSLQSQFGMEDFYINSLTLKTQTFQNVSLL